MRVNQKTVAIVIAVLMLAALVFAAYALGRRAGCREAEADEIARSALSNALRVQTDSAMARALQSANVTKVLRDLEGDMLLNACLLGIGASPESTDVDTATSAQAAFDALDRYIEDFPSAVLTNKGAATTLHRSRESIAVWLHALTNAQKRASCGIAYDRKAVISD